MIQRQHSFRKNKMNDMKKTINDLQNDGLEILRLCRIVSQTGSDMESIFNLYKKYIDGNARQYNTNGCQTCGNSIVVYWRELCLFYNNNKNMFE